MPRTVGGSETEDEKGIKATLINPTKTKVGGHLQGSRSLPCRHTPPTRLAHHQDLGILEWVVGGLSAVDLQAVA